MFMPKINSVKYSTESRNLSSILKDVQNSLSLVSIDGMGYTICRGGAEERIWENIQDESFREQQYLVSNHFVLSQYSLRCALVYFIQKAHQHPETEAKIVLDKLLRFATYNRQIISESAIAFDWFREISSLRELCHSFAQSRQNRFWSLSFHSIVD